MTYYNCLDSFHHDHISFSNGVGTYFKTNATGATTFVNPNMLYFTDTNNCVVRLLNSANVGSIAVATIAGSPKSCSTNVGPVDSIGTFAFFLFPTFITNDMSGNLIVSDTGNNCIRMISGISSPNPYEVVTVAGNYKMPGCVNTGTPANLLGASFRSPQGVALDSYGNIYVADSQNMAIRIINTAIPLVATIAGYNCGTLIPSGVIQVL